MGGKGLFIDCNTLIGERGITTYFLDLCHIICICYFIIFYIIRFIFFLFSFCKIAYSPYFLLDIDVAVLFYFCFFSGLIYLFLQRF